MKKFVIAFILCYSSFNLYSQVEFLSEDESPYARNIILLIGDGMGVAQIYAGIATNTEPLNIERFKNIGFAKTHSEDNFITDSGASGTALATGRKTYNGAISVDSSHNPIKTILEYAEEYDKSTGLVATSTITHATPAAFIAHQASRSNYELIASDFLKTDIELFIGGGLDHFNQREDQVDLTHQLLANGYQLVYDKDSLEIIEQGKVAALLYPGSPPRYSEGRKDMLPVSVNKSLEILDQDEDGFFLMIEGSQIDWAAHDHSTDTIVEELLDFDRAIGLALNYAIEDGNTLVIVTADHETGGMTITGGDLKKGVVEASYSTGGHTAVMVPVFAYGPGAEQFQGIYDNTEIFNKMMTAFGFTDYGISPFPFPVHRLLFLFPPYTCF